MTLNTRQIRDVYVDAMARDHEDLESYDAAATKAASDFDQWEASRERRLYREEKKSAAANKENDRLRAEIRSLRHKNFMLQSSLESDNLQGYIVRYNKLYEAFVQVKDILNVKLDGLPDEPPKTMERPKAPAWAKIKSEGTSNG